MDTLLCEANKVATSHTSQVRRGRGSGFNAVAMAGEESKEQANKVSIDS